jgi:hypothetical protein
LPSEVIRPGRDLVTAARALEDPRRMLGKYPYQWLFPGPHSRQVLANNSIALPNMGAGLTPIIKYQVPDGWRFCLRGIVFAFFGTGWNEGVGDLTFNLAVQAAGTRNVDFLVSVKTHLGSPDFPFPIMGRLEFAPLDVLIASVTNVTGAVGAGPPNAATAILVGHTYPNSES